MNCLLAIKITTEACQWISRNPSYVLWPGLLALIILVVALIYLFKYKSSKANAIAKLTAEKKKADDISTQLLDTKKKLTTAKADLKKTRQENEILNAQVVSLSEISRERDQLKTSVEQKDGIISELEGHLSTAKEQFDSTKNLLEQANKDIQQLKKDNQKISLRKDELEREVGTLRESDRAKTDKITGFMFSLSDKDDIIAQKDEIIRELEDRLSKVPDVTKLKEENDLYIGKLQKTTADLDAKEKALEEANQLAKTRGEKIETLQKELREANSSIDKLNKEIEELKQKIAELSKSVGGPGTDETPGDDEGNGTDEGQVPTGEPGTDETPGDNEGNGSDEGEAPVEEPGTDATPWDDEGNGTDEGQVPTGEPGTDETPGDDDGNGTDEGQVPTGKPGTDETQGDDDGNDSDEGQVPTGEPGTDETSGDDESNGPDEGEAPTGEPGTDETSGGDESNGSDEGQGPIDQPGTDETPGDDGNGTDERQDPIDQPETDETPEDSSEEGDEPQSEPGKGGFFDFIPTVQEDDENEDLPSIDKKTGKVKRSILQVIDIEQEPPITIDSDEFFNEEPEKIARVARMLAEADETGREAYLCACCENPVKIAKRDYGYREVLFFSHCQRDIECEWKQDHRVIKKTPKTGLSSGSGTSIDIKAKRRMIKDLIVRSLQSEESKAKGVKDVEEEKRIKSNYRFMRYRIAGIYARYKERNLIFELQTRDVLMNTVVNKDIFYRLHDHHVIWIFGADEGTGYDYINKHVNVNTMYANRRNVFIIDKEAIDACEERHELVLKCNYLDPDNKWHYRNETTGNNGILITLDDLLYDEEMCKPYFFDANIEYFKLHPDAETNYIESIVTREKLLKDMEDTYNGRLAERRKKTTKPKDNTPPPSKPVSDPISDSGLKPEITETGFNNRYYYFLNGKYGIVDGDNNFIIPCKYDDIECWTLGKYRVLVIDQWGVVDDNNNTVVEIKYRSIGDLNNGKALVETSLESYYIDDNGIRLPDEAIKIHKGWVKFRFGNQWGIMDEKKNVIVECVYDEIGSFRRRLIGIRNGSFQKLIPRYEYRLKMHCKCTDNIGNRAVYDMNGLLLKETSMKEQTKGKIYKKKVISNISFNTNTIYINNVSAKKENEKFEHVDNDYDFTMGEVLTGVILKKVMKKIFIQFKDGRLTYITRTTIEKAGKQLADYGKGKEITLQKIGYDSDFERTEWKFVESNT